jgi:hypothetical protein
VTFNLDIMPLSLENQPHEQVFGPPKHELHEPSPLVEVNNQRMVVSSIVNPLESPKALQDCQFMKTYM